MAGGKETPRQKMIGMMYLVLTALLALNVSKSILDAFVAIEENTQKSNIVQVDRGNGFYADVKSELAATKGEDQAAKRKKLEYVLSQMDKINKETETMIKYIDDLKVNILKTSGENVETFQNNDELTMMWEKGDGVKPIRMNLFAVQAKDQYDIPMQIMCGTDQGGDIKNIKGSGADMWKKYNDFRSKIVELTGSYEWGENNKFSIKPEAFNQYETNAELQKKVESMIDKSKANLKEDRQVLVDLYMMLTKREKNKVHGVEGVHWVGATFDHSPLVAAVASLSSMQQDILSARALALAHWKSKVTTGEYSFNKIMPLAYGPAVVNNGDSVELQVMMAAFDSDNQPKVTIDGMEGANIVYKGDGQGRIFLKAGNSQMDLSGTVAIKNKSGVEKKEKWAHSVIVMKPQGTVSLPEMNVLYRGYNNIVEGVASGYDQTILNGSGVSLSKKGNQWVAKTTTSGREASISVSGKSSATGKTANLGSFKFRVSNLPPPQVYLGTIGTGSSVSSAGLKAMSKLFAKYPPEIPLNASFAVASYEITVSGAPRPARGTGATLSPGARSLLKQAKPGSTVSISAKYKGMGYSGNMATIIKVK